MAADTELRVAVTMTNVRQLKTVTKELDRIGKTSKGIKRVGTEAGQAGQKVEEIGKFAKFTLNVLEAFLLYKGFVFLKTQAEEFTRELVNLEHQVSIIQTQLGDVPQDFQPLVRGRIIQTAEATGASLESLADAQFSIVSANIELSDSFQVLDAVTRAAVAGGLTDVNVAVQSVITQMNAFGLEASDTTEILDKQFNLVRRGIFTYEQFARVSGMISVAFSDIGQSLETANAALAVVSQVFTGRQLRFGATALRNLASAIGENSEEFEDLGVAVFDEQGNFRSFIDIMRDLKTEMQGLSEQQRFEALRNIFPDEREIRGAITILGRLDDFEQFFIEQQFAIGDLDNAYQTVNESLKTQAQIFRNELIPAVEPVLLIFNDMLTVINTLNDALPGFTRGLLQAGAAFATLRLAGLASATSGGMGVSRAVGGGVGRGIDPILGGMVGARGFQQGRIASTFTRRPTGLGLALGGAVGATLFETGRRAEPGFDQGGLAAALLTGGATGAVLGGGVPGGVAGAAVGGALFAFGEAFEAEAPDTAKAWNERFRQGVLDEGQGIGRALSNVIAEEVGGDGGRDLASRVQEVVLEPLEFAQFQRRDQFAPDPLTLAVREVGQFFREDFATELVRTGTQEVDLRGAIIDAIREAEAQETEIRALAATGAASQETIRREVIEVAFEDFVQGLGELNEQNEAQVATARNVVNILTNFEATSEDARSALDTLVNDGINAFLEELEGAVVADIPLFRERFAQFSNQIAFDADEVSSALNELGLEATGVGQSFGELARVFQAQEFVNLFQQGGLISDAQAGTLTQAILGAPQFGAFGGQAPTEFTSGQLTSVLEEQFVAFVRGEIEEETSSALETFGLATIGLADVMTQAADNIEEGLAPALDMGIMELRGFAESFRQFNQRIQTIQLIEELLGLSDALNLSDSQMENLNEAIVILANQALTAADSSFLSGNPQDMADFFLGLVQASQAQRPTQVEPDELDIPGQTRLQQAMIDTATAFEQGLLTSANFTSQQLRDMGQDLAVFNKQIRKIQLVEEIGRVAEIAGVGIDLTSTIQNLIQRLTIGGDTLANLIEDPERLADLIATAEFREVNLDQSTQNTFTIRISSDADPSRAAELADSIMREVNNRVQETVA